MGAVPERGGGACCIDRIGAEKLRISPGPGVPGGLIPGDMTPAPGE